MSNIKISDLTPDNKNYNKGSEFGNSLIEKSLRKFGAGRSILIDKNNRIIAGNKTIENAGAIGLDDIIVVETTGNQIVAVKRMDIDLDSKQGRELALADNASAKANINWDFETINFDWNETEIKEWGLEIPDFEVLEAEEDDFAVPDGGTETDIVLGDLFEIGEHRLLCGDSNDICKIEELINNQDISMIFTDPPYGIGIDGQKESKASNPKHNRKNHEFMGWDNQRPSEDIFQNILSYNIPTVIFGGNYFADILPASRGWIYWSKGQDGLTMSDGELAWTNLDKPLRCVVVNRANIGKSVHPTQKPIQVVEFGINYATESGSVLDLFGGSGSTMVACHNLKRKNFTMELEPKYCQVIVDRMKKLDPSLIIKKNGLPL